MIIPRPAPIFVHEAAPESQSFRFQDGSRARSLAEFVEAIERESPTTVAFHREHFAPWLREVLRDEPLARRVEGYARAGGEADIFRETLLALARARLAQLTAQPA